MARLALFALTVGMLAYAAPGTAVAITVPTQNQVTQVWSAPAHPKPGEEVMLTARTLGNTAGYTYVWTIGGDLVAEGPDATNVRVTAGVAGSATEVVATLLDQEGAIRGSRTYVIRPAEVDLVWEGDTALTPFVKRRPLPNAEGEVVVQAVPRLVSGGGVLPANELLYMWKVDGKAIGKAAQGKSSVRIEPPFFGNKFSISVVVENVDGTIAAENKIDIVPAVAGILIYEDRPLSGVLFNRAVAGGMTLADDEVTFRAFPINVTDIKKLSYQWRLNGTPFSLDTSDKRSATFRRAGEGTLGSFFVEFSFSNSARTFEQAARSFRVTLE